jgi:hypothetical protein
MGQLTFQATLGGSVNLAGPNTASTTTFTLPAADGTNGQALTTNGSGTLAFATVGASAATPTALGTVYGAMDTGAYGQAFIGYGAGGSNTTSASNNTAMGNEALYSNTAGTHNSAFGFKALWSTATGGDENSAFGSLALYANTTGDSNVAVGRQALRFNTTASFNTAVGYQAGYGITTGEYNTCVGNATGNGNVVSTTGSFNTLIGHNSSTSVATDTASIVISASNNAAQSVGKGSGTGFISAYFSAFGNIYQGNNGATWAVTSDQRLKKNIVDNNIGLEKLTQIQVRNFEYRLPEEVTELGSQNAIQKSGVQLGVIAQELKAVLPECVKTESTGVMSVQSDNLTWYLINAVKELSARVKQLEGN